MYSTFNLTQLLIKLCMLFYNMKNTFIQINKKWQYLIYKSKQCICNPKLF